MECRACGGDLGRTVSVREMMYGTGEQFRYQQCDVCETLWLQDVPADFSAYYQDGYYSLRAGSRTPSAWDVYRWMKSRAYNVSVNLGVRWPGGLKKPAYARFGELAGIRRNSRILDVGCGSGEFLYELRRSGFSNLTGFDPFLPATVDSRGVRLIKGDWSQVSGLFDVVMMHHSLEHVPEPLETLKLARERLAPGGKLLVRLPVLGEAWRIYGEDWIQLDAPRHTVLFSQSGLLTAADRAGLSLVGSYCDSTSFQFWGSEQCRMGIPLNDERSLVNGLEGSPFTQADIDDWAERAEELNRSMAGDQAVFAFRCEGTTSA